MDLSSPRSNFLDHDVVNDVGDAEDPWKARYADKIKNAQQAVLVIKPGQRVFVGTACATPRALVVALEDLPNLLLRLVIFFDSLLKTVLQRNDSNRSLLTFDRSAPPE